MIDDSIFNKEKYGHLQWENSVGAMGSDRNNPYPDNFEPVKPEGTNLFRPESVACGFICLGLDVEATINFYIWEELEEWRKPDTPLPTHVENIHESMCQDYINWELESIKTFNSEEACINRLNCIQANTEFRRCEHEDEAYRKRVQKKYPELLKFEVRWILDLSINRDSPPINHPKKNYSSCLGSSCIKLKSWQTLYYFHRLHTYRNHTQEQIKDIPRGFPCSVAKAFGSF